MLNQNDSIDGSGILESANLRIVASIRTKKDSHRKREAAHRTSIEHLAHKASSFARILLHFGPFNDS